MRKPYIIVFLPAFALLLLLNSTILRQKIISCVFVAHKKKNWDGRKPRVAFVLAVKGTGNQSEAVSNFANSSLATILLPSVLKTCEWDNYRYGMFIGYDTGDVVWEDELVQNRTKSIVAGYPVDIHFVRFDQTVEKRIPFSETARYAYDNYQPDYYVRINDDSEFTSPGWTSQGVSTLLSYTPPNVGVVGPTCNEGKTDILTHDMVHKSHMDIFNRTYYPWVFRNWYVDDWISCVYGEKRTTRHPGWSMTHHTNKHGRRYEPDKAQGGSILEDELRRGRLLIEASVAHGEGMVKEVVGRQSESHEGLRGWLANRRKKAPTSRPLTCPAQFRRYR